MLFAIDVSSTCIYHNICIYSYTYIIKELGKDH